MNHKMLCLFLVVLAIIACTPQAWGSTISVASESSYGVNPYTGTTEDISAQGNLDWVIIARSEKDNTDIIATDGGTLLETTPTYYWAGTLGSPTFDWTGGLGGGTGTGANAGVTYSPSAESPGTGTHIALPAGSGTLSVWWVLTGAVGNNATFTTTFDDSTTFTTDAITGAPTGRKTVLNWQTDTAQTLTFATNVDGGIYAMAVSTVPEPCTLILLGSGLMGLLAYAWRKRK